MQPSLQHGGQNGGPTSCECHELFSGQNALRMDKYGQILQYVLKTNYLRCNKHATKTSFFTFRSPLIVQRLKGGKKTFAEIAESLLSMALNEGTSSDRIDVVFDGCQDDSIKSAERENRGKGSRI